MKSERIKFSRKSNNSQEGGDVEDYLKGRTRVFKFEDQLANRVVFGELNLKNTDLKKFLELLGLASRKNK